MAETLFDAMLGTLVQHAHRLTNLVGNLAQARTHDSPDTDSAPAALHHTLGTGVNQAMAGNTSIPAAPLVATRDVILATSPATVRLALATDTRRVYFADGSAWLETPIQWSPRATTPDMGAEQDSSRGGYGLDYVTDKLLANIDIGNAADVSRAGDNRMPLRCVNGAFQVYLNGAWQNVVLGFRLREESGSYEFEHQPIAGGEWVEIASGNGNTLGLSGLPLVQQYAASMGAYPVPLVVDGGTF